MKNIALLYDFNVGTLMNPYKQDSVDIYRLERLGTRIKDIIKNGIEDLEIDDLSLSDFYQTISLNYDHIICLFQSYSPINIVDHKEKEFINQHKTQAEAKLAMFLIQYSNPVKENIACKAIEMIEAGQSIRDVIVRIDQIKATNGLSWGQLISNNFTKLSYYY